ncbi:MULTISPECIES: GNAT family N-acetyltransferase [Xenorhabdus]|uniref:GNAT family N-acetyltransferase n=1 Tax=Xenorhabdus TaxID=626 RepID=UPI000647D3C3|nr:MULTISPECIES: GNAT family N-acetyltransferase [Xenorhabdus]MBC8946078.1 N-acetyltransferase [Xenorhabdus indica]
MPNTPIRNDIPSTSHSSPILEEGSYPDYKTIIKEVSKEDMISALNGLKRNEALAHPDMRRHQSFISTANSINNIYTNTSIGGNINTHRYFACFCTPEPVGIMIFIPASSVISHDTADLIGYILTYPGGRGYGSLLIEYAVNFSISLNHSGMLKLYAERYAIPIYQRLGFVFTGNSNFGAVEMCLDPKISNRWSVIPNGYRLTKSHSLFNWQCHIL